MGSTAGLRTLRCWRVWLPLRVQVRERAWLYSVGFEEGVEIALADPDHPAHLVRDELAAVDEGVDRPLRHTEVLRSINRAIPSDLLVIHRSSRYVMAFGVREVTTRGRRILG